MLFVIPVRPRSAAEVLARELAVCVPTCRRVRMALAGDSGTHHEGEAEESHATKNLRTAERVRRYPCHVCRLCNDSPVLFLNADTPQIARSAIPDREDTPPLRVPARGRMPGRANRGSNAVAGGSSSASVRAPGFATVHVPLCLCICHV